MRNGFARLVGYACAGLLLSGCAGLAGTEPVRRNVILFLGDGMGVSTVTAARIFAGQSRGVDGEAYELAFEAFPHVALVKTYNTDSQVPDSAGTMSAIMTGEKTRIGFINVAPAARRDDCAAARANERSSLLEDAERAGFATGIVSTARITHATPAATYAHVPNRNWEVDGQLPEAARSAGCTDIARQLVEFPHGDGIDVILGGGRSAFKPAEAVDPEYPKRRGTRSDGKDLVAAWLARGGGRQYLWNGEQFSAQAPDTPDQILGLFEPSHMRFDADRGKDPGTEPSLAELTEFAIRRLANRGPGYFLMVEAGRIDHAHHGGNAYRALQDTVALSDAVAKAVAMTEAADTLIVVTADHSHTLTISGYPRRGNPILGKVHTARGEMAKDAEGRPYTTLSYANGPGYRPELPDLSQTDTEAANFLQIATFPVGAETHAGEDVAAYARGLNAGALGGVIEQNEIYRVMRDALLGSRR